MLYNASASVHKANVLEAGEGYIRMEPLIEKKKKNASIELEVKIEELEDRIAPDGGETTLPLPALIHKR